MVVIHTYIHLLAYDQNRKTSKDTIHSRTHAHAQAEESISLDTATHTHTHTIPPTRPFYEGYIVLIHTFTITNKHRQKMAHPHAHMHPGAVHPFGAAGQEPEDTLTSTHT